MENNPYTLPLIKPFLFFAGVVLVVGILFFSLNKASESRKEAVYTTYATETNNYIQKNHEKTIQIFSAIRNDMKQCLPNSSSCTITAETEKLIASMPATLKDWSSTAFLTQGPRQPTIVRLSGDFHEVYDNEQADLLTQLLSGSRQKLPWDDYTYDLAGKEVIIPVKDTQGKTIGAIVRAVIEDTPQK